MFTRKHARTRLFVYLTVVFHFKCACATRLIHFRNRTAESGRCKEYSLPTNALPSDKGKLWEYYHFLVDFAPAIYYHVRDDAARCKQLYVPGWLRDDRFKLTNSHNPQRSMQGVFDYFLGAPLNLTLVPVANEKKMNQMLKSKNVTLIDWNCHQHGRQWANQCEYYYTEFRNHAVKLLSLGNPVHTPSDAIVVNRSQIANYHGGYDRRHLGEEFYQQLLGNLTHKHQDNPNILIKALEHTTAAEQVDLFSNTQAVIAQHGAALSNMLFMRPQALVIEIGHRNWLCYQTLAEKLQLNYMSHEPTNYSGVIGDALKQRLKDIHEVMKMFASMRQGKLPLSDNKMLEGIPCPASFKCFGKAFRSEKELGKPLYGCGLW